MLIDIVYLVSVVLLASYGLNAIVMVGLYMSRRRETTVSPIGTDAPSVTVQLPIYNEMYVLDRLLAAVVNLDYPQDRLQIQVLDDSTDETVDLAEELVRQYVSQGVNIELLHRTNRSGFKAGALKASLPSASGEYIAIFDADFVPEPDFLQRTIPYFLANPKVGLIQTRWGHVNADYSTLTRAQAIALDGHFVIEQTARNRSELFMNFNGTAGIWRKSCIESAGGWQDDTICEDLDLSYRAQLKGWEFLYLPDVVVPAEIPPQLNAFKRQQFRWAKGSMQCAFKLTGTVLRRTDYSWFKRIQAVLHLTNYSVHPLMVILLLTTLPFILTHSPLSRYVGLLSFASLGPPMLYAIAQRNIHPDWVKRFTVFPLLMLLGTGIAWSNSRAIWEAITGRQNQFHRTPKFRVEGRADTWADSPYALSFDWDTLGELALAIYAAVTIVVALQQHNYAVVPFLIIYLAGFGLVASLDIAHAAKRRPKQPVVEPSVAEPPRLVAKSSVTTFTPSTTAGQTIYLSHVLQNEEKNPLSKVG